MSNGLTRYLQRREERAVRPTRFGEELQRTFNPNAVAAQFDRLVRPLGR